MTPHENSTQELEDRRTQDGLLQGKGLGTNRCSKRVRNIVCTDPESGEEGPEGTDYDDPEEVVGCLRDKMTILDDTHHAANWIVR